MAFLCIFWLGAWAQIQITSSDLPSAGQSFTVSQSRPQPGWDFLTTGPNHTWNFGQLPPDTQIAVEWKGPWQVIQYSFSCGNASLQALLLKVADSIPTPTFMIRDVYAFLRKSPSQMAVHGVGASVNGIPLTQCYQDADELYLLPLSYGDTDSTTFWLRLNLTTPSGSIIWAQRGYRLHNADGYGQLTTPYGTFSVLRLMRRVRQKDTIYWNGLPFRTSDTSFVELEWLGQGQGIPLLRVQGTMRTIGGVPSFLPASIQFKDTVRTSSLTLRSEKPTIAPNPSRGILQVSLPGAKFEIYNLIGKLMISGEVPQDSTLRLPPTLPEGVYFLKLIHGAKEYWYRFSLMWN
ncbi:MAG: T9SS type A sorting domain-containing protein [Bacteroidia bacterium]|nr:T9SS type A sorting domain-containing protein [Bacteroidia bacterium]